MPLTWPELIRRCCGLFFENNSHELSTSLRFPSNAYGGSGTPAARPAPINYRGREWNARWACSLPGRRQHEPLPVTLHIRTCRICRMVRAFGPSGLEVSSAESDSAVRYRHGEFESSHGAGEFVAGLSWHRLIAASTSSSAPRSCHDPGRRTVADYANPRASRRRSGPPDAIREPNRPRAATALIDGRSGLQTCLIQCIIESASESLPYHCR
jgi:hypothetical protein